MTVQQLDTSIEGLYLTYRSALYAFLQRQVGNAELAEDLCQDTFVKALRAWETRDPHANAAAWLYQIARNTAYDELRRRRRIDFLPLVDEDAWIDDRPDLEHQISTKEPVQHALAKLSALYRLPLVMHALGYSVKEIAALLECSPNTIKARLFRARIQMRQGYNA